MTTTPLYPLDVVGDVNTNSAYKIGGTNVLTSTSLTVNGTTSTGITSVATSNSSALITSGGVYNTLSGGAGDLVVSSVSFTDMTIDNATLGKMSEVIYNAGAQSSNSISLNYSNGCNFYLTPFSSTNFSAAITNIPTTTLTGSYTFNIIANTSTNKSYCSSLTVNGTSVTMQFNGGNSSVSISSASYTIQNFVLVYINSTTPTFCITGVTSFHA